MIHALLFSIALLAQDPAPPPAPAPAPQAQPDPPQAQPDPRQEKPARSRDDRLEERLLSEPKPEAPPEAPAETPADTAPPAAVPAPPARAPHPLDGYEVVNSAALIVNEELVTLRDFNTSVERRRANLREPGSRSRDQMRADEIVARAKFLLELQGGKDLGFNPEQIDRFVRRKMEEEVDEAGSITQFASELKEEGLDSFERREEYYARVHRLLWEEAATGRGAAPGGRIAKDSFIRPGFAQFVQREALRQQAGTRLVDATQAALPIDAPGATERVKKRLEDLRTRVGHGEDMGELSEQFRACPVGTKGKTGFVRLGDLRSTNPVIAAFLDKAEVGEISPVLEFFSNGKVIGYAVVRAEEFKVTPVQPFDQPAGQRTWIEGQSRRLADMHVQRGLGKLLEAAYVWPPNLFQ